MLASILSVTVLGNALDGYVGKQDPNFKWHDTNVVVKFPLLRAEAHILNVTSQQWLTTAQAVGPNGALWTHQVAVVLPKTRAANGTAVAATQLTLNPNMGPLEGRAYCDTIVGFTAPRMAAILGIASAGPGCTDSDACNYNTLATSDDGSCTYAEAGFNCAGEPIAAGCTQPLACNYDNTATLEDGSCNFLDSDAIPTGAEATWVVGLTLTGWVMEILQLSLITNQETKRFVNR